MEEYSAQQTAWLLSDDSFLSIVEQLSQGKMYVAQTQKQKTKQQIILYNIVATSIVLKLANSCFLVV